MKSIDDSQEDEEDVSLYRSINKKFKEEDDDDYNSKAINYAMYGDTKGPSVPISATRRLRIDSSESEKVEIVEESDEEWPEEHKKIYGTDNHEWNNYQQLTGEIFEFLGSNFYLKQFQRTLEIPRGTSTLRPFLYMAQSYNSEITNEPGKLRQDIDGLY